MSTELLLFLPFPVFASFTMFMLIRDLRKMNKRHRTHRAYEFRWSGARKSDLCLIDPKDIKKLATLHET